MSNVMTAAQREALRLLSTLPEDSSFDEIQYQLHVLQKARRGMADVDAGRVCTGEEARLRLSRWLD